MILVSACLAGINCKYSGGNNYNEKVFNLVKEGKAIPICPEQLGGLQTPRNPAEIKIVDGKKYVIDEKNNNVTENFEKGAKEVLEFAKKLGAKTENNNIVVNDEMQTSIENIYACGDCTGGILQISKAVYEGTKAGLVIINKLRRKEN